MVWISYENIRDEIIAGVGFENIEKGSDLRCDDREDRGLNLPSIEIIKQVCLKVVVIYAKNKAYKALDKFPT